MNKIKLLFYTLFVYHIKWAIKPSRVKFIVDKLNFLLTDKEKKVLNAYLKANEEIKKE